MRVYDQKGVLKSFCETMPDTKRLYDLIKELDTILEVTSDTPTSQGERMSRVQVLTQAIITLSGSMSQVLEVVKSINTQNDKVIQGLSDLDGELQNEPAYEGMRSGEVWLNLEREKIKFPGYDDSDRIGADVYPYCAGLLHQFVNIHRMDISRRNLLLLEKLFQKKRRYIINCD